MSGTQVVDSIQGDRLWSLNAPLAMVHLGSPFVVRAHGMTPLQQKMVLSWVAAAAIVILALFFVANEKHTYLLVGFLGIPIHRYLRKGIDTDNFRPLQEMKPFEQVIALLWYLLAAGVIIFTVVKHPKAINYEFGQFLILLGVVFIPLMPVMYRREASLFKQAGKHEA
jgi:hypothetical protein